MNKVYTDLRRRGHGRAARCAVAAALSCAGAAALAQQSDAPRETGVLQEIIVTAQKRSAAHIQDVPLSMSAVSGNTLERLGAATFSDYLPMVPGVSFVSVGPAQTKIIMRGISSADGPESADTVAVYLDEVPITSPGAPVAGVQPFSLDMNTFDLERVEVLRGPQGTLYGASSMGGTIRLITNKPNPAGVEAKTEGALSTTRSGGENYSAQGMLNLPLVPDRLAARVVGYHRHDAGFIDNAALQLEDVDDMDMTGARLALRYQASEALTIDAKISHQSLQTEGTTWSDIGAAALVQNRLSSESHDDEMIQYNLAIDYDLGWGKVISSSSYDDRKAVTINDSNVFLPAFLGINLPGAHNINTNDYQRTIQELRFASAWDHPLQLVLGAYYFDQDQTLLQSFPMPGIDAALGIDTGMFGTAENTFEGNIFRDIAELAFFGELTYALSEKLEATAGLRAFDLDQDFRNFSQGWANGGMTAGRTDNSESGTTPKVALSYKASKDVLLYTSATQGYRFGGISEIVPEAACGAGLAALGLSAEDAARYDSDSLWNYELGLKSEWADQRLVVNVAAFYIDWSDIQTIQFLPCQFGFVENSGSATSTGVEWELIALPLPELQLRFSGSYTDAQFDRTPLEGVEEGDRLPGAPRLTLSSSAQYTRALGESADGYLRADYQYIGSRVPFAGLTEELDAYSIISLRAGLLYESWEVALFARNLLDEQAELAFSPLAGYSRNPPRTIGLSVNWSYR